MCDFLRNISPPSNFREVSDIWYLYILLDQVLEISVIFFRNLNQIRSYLIFTFFSRSVLGVIKLILSTTFIFSSSSNMRKVHVPVVERQEQLSLLWSPGYFGQWLPWPEYQDWKLNTGKSSWTSGIRDRILRITIMVNWSPAWDRRFFEPWDDSGFLSPPPHQLGSWSFRSCQHSFVCLKLSRC